MISLYLSFFLKVDDEFFFLKKSKPEIFLKNWRKFESCIFPVLKKNDKSAAGRELLKRAERASENFGNIHTQIKYLQALII